MGREDWVGAEPNISALRSVWVLQGEFSQAATVLGWTFTSVIRAICLVASVTSLESCLHSLPSQQQRGRGCPWPQATAGGRPWGGITIACGLLTQLLTGAKVRLSPTQGSGLAQGHTTRKTLSGLESSHCLCRPGGKSTLLPPR